MTRHNVQKISLLILILVVGIWGAIDFQTKKSAYLRGESITYSKNEVLGLEGEEDTIYIDFTQPVSKVSPLIFGGSNPRKMNKETWSDLSNAGVTAVRVPLFVEHSVPKNSSIDAYLRNENDIKNTQTWEKSVINQQTEALKSAKEKGMTTLAVMEFSPAWLSSSKTEFGVPANWEIYQEIVQKMYAQNRQYVDYIEIWNEPDWDHFLDLKNSKYSREEAYLLIFLNAAKAIREYDIQMNDGKSVQIGGPVLSKLENTKVLEKLLSSAEARKYLSFVSIHNYQNHQELDTTEIRTILEENNAGEIPLFLTEWNYQSDEKTPSPHLISGESIPFTTSQFLKMMHQKIHAGFFFALQPIETKNMGNGHGYLAFFEDKAKKRELLPMAKSWTLLSKTMKLGEGENTLLTTSDSSQMISGLKNHEGEKVIVAVNNSTEKVTHTIVVKLDTSNTNYLIDTYSASDVFDPTKKIRSLSVKAESQQISFKVVLPEMSSTGFIIHDALGLIL
jgi:hypothetical protein